MILTIQAPSKSLFLAGVWQAEMMMGLEVETHAGNTFEIVCHHPNKVDAVLRACNGKVINQSHSTPL